MTKALNLYHHQKKTKCSQNKTSSSFRRKCLDPEKVFNTQLTNFSLPMTLEERIDKRYEDSKPLRKVDRGMGKTAEAAESELVKEINEYAEELGIDTDLNQVDTHSRFSQSNNEAVLYGETYGGIHRWVGETTAFLYDNDDAQAASYKDPNGPAVRLGNGDININEEHLRATGDWLKNRGKSHLEPQRAS